MVRYHLKAFLKEVNADSSLQEKLKAATDADAVLAIAKEAGCVVSVDEIKDSQPEVSAEEMEGLAEFKFSNKSLINLRTSSIQYSIRVPQPAIVHLLQVGFHPTRMVSVVIFLFYNLSLGNSMCC